MKWGLCFLVVSVSLAQQVTKPEKGVIEGQVTSALSGELVSQAKVTLRSLDGREVAGTRTAADGRFALRSIDAGRYRLWADHSGYVRGEYGTRSANRSGTVLAVGPGSRLTAIDIPLMPLSAIAGRIVDEKREPLQNVEVNCLQYGSSEGRREFSLAAGGTTNDLGEFRIYGLPPSRYLIAAIYRPERFTLPPRDKDSSDEEGYVTTYYPGTAELTGAVWVDLAPGKEIRGIEFSPMRRPVAQVRGRVSKASGVFCTRPNVMLSPRDVAGALNTRAVSVRDPEGNFEIREVPAGSYTIFAQCHDGTNEYKAGRLIDVGAGGLGGVDLTLSPGIDVTGRIRIAKDEPLALDGLRIRLESRDSPLNLANERVRPDGSFTLRGVAADTYSVALTGAPDDLYVRSIMVEGSDIMDTGLGVSDAGVVRQLEVVLSRGAQIEGAVLDEQKVLRGAAVVIVPASGHRGRSYRYKSTTTDQFGRFVLPGIAPGEYTMFAWEDAEGVAYKEADVIARFEKSGEPVHVQESERKTVQLRLIPSGQ
jgi:hypothetical protein